jgi:serine/threonine protein kinase
MNEKSTSSSVTEEMSVVDYESTFDICDVPETWIPSRCEKIVRYAKKRIEKLPEERKMCFQDNLNKIEVLHHSQIELGEQLGRGAFSMVFSVKSIRRNDNVDDNAVTDTKANAADEVSSNNINYNENQVVIKFLRPKLYSEPAIFAACAGDLVKEGMIMSSLNHENILSVKACAPFGFDSYLNGHHDAFFLVLEKLPFTLSMRLEKWQKEFKKTKRPILRLNPFQRNSKNEDRITHASSLLNERLDAAIQLAKAIEYLHSQRILHRDLKPENIGFDANDTLKIFDFDVARVMPQQAILAENETFHLTRRVGSPRYMSPECARGEAYNMKADVYAFGLLCHELITLEKPYDDISNEDHDQLVFLNHVRPVIPEHLPTQTQNLLAKCFSPDITVRPIMKEVCQILMKEVPKILAASAMGGQKSPLSSKRTLGSTLPSRTIGNDISLIGQKPGNRAGAIAVGAD